MPAKVISERLGHANIAITMDTYSHVLPGMDERAARVCFRSHSHSLIAATSTVAW